MGDVEKAKEDDALCNLCANVRTQAELDAVRALHRRTMYTSWPIHQPCPQQTGAGLVWDREPITLARLLQKQSQDQEVVTLLEPTKPSLKERSTEKKTKGLPQLSKMLHFNENGKHKVIFHVLHGNTCLAVRYCRLAFSAGVLMRCLIRM